MHPDEYSSIEIGGLSFENMDAGALFSKHGGTFLVSIHIH